MGQPNQGGRSQCAETAYATVGNFVTLYKDMGPKMLREAYSNARKDLLAWDARCVVTFCSHNVGTDDRAHAARGMLKSLRTLALIVNVAKLRGVNLKKGA